MKTALFPVGFVIALAGFATHATAACAAPSARVNTIDEMRTLLLGNTVCVPDPNPAPEKYPAMVSPALWKSQELHQAPNVLWDYKRDADPRDPSKQVGNWSVTGRDGRAVFVSYDYGGGQVYTYAVWNNGDGTHSFCSANPEIKVTIKRGGGSC